ncbi:hypothetical protein XM38_041330 [Halomicronema hongdechloris C2206]|uniref:VOC domain-containing protein n=1 Tax=Halomicronema hongdechloris C2206 TaxID=1641165 RepID=A0A1Z3HS83_9CYAN|nr:VOC family protein [Halomicronema hongdechloris]ASC73171.1 hypothetical protein XM38_041330 [Halomicronema hongdechloris C2206]
MHHASIRTADIHRAIAFLRAPRLYRAGTLYRRHYPSLLAGRAGGRIELMQVPQPRPAADAFADEHYTGYYHLSFDLTDRVASLSEWLSQLQHQFDQASQPLIVLLSPQQQMIGATVYEVMFLADADGLPLEFLREMGHG